MKKIRIIGSITILIFLLFIIIKNLNRSKEYKTQVYGAFDTYTVISIYDKNPKEAEEKLKILSDKFEAMSKDFDGFNNYEGINNLKTINDNAGIKEIKVSDDLFDLISRTKELEERFKLGKLNIAIGPVTNIWRDYSDLYNQGLSKEEVISKKGSELPRKTELEKLRPLIDQNNVIINKDKKTIYLSKKEMSLDLGAVAKGYAVEILSQYAIKDLDIESIIISSGGNVKCLNKDGIDRKYKVAIYNPEIEDKDKKEISEKDQYLITLNLKNKAVVTTGDYQRYFILEEKRYPHIIDPTSLETSDKYRSISVISDNSFIADYLSTSLFLLDQERVKDLEKENDFWVVYLDNNEEVYISEKLKDLIGD
ncbi:FAD:protein FMN transferase [Peptoniphilus obesi]|uniref:FAD:protein FMN transferase n=1 Tax=Peptoniphilus obesi TaxID=1472765 RepID=UPI0004BB9BEE|nr:FAD:protein FMN transferase [Peptoniphilus obesi]